ncbi:Ig-like domain-containing protein [Leptospira terpstrae]|uniref:Ig-like domain-containing protein n=1 Tax=Leptospira terpstrae TaxID=293075 RepID=UPI003D00B812
MNRNLSLPTLLSFLSLWMLLGNCYFNPIVNGILNPVEEESNNLSLGLLGLVQGTSNLLITGQIRDPNGVALQGLVLIPSLTSFQSKSVLSPYTTDKGGRFFIPYQPGSFPFTVYRDDLYFFEFILTVGNPTDINYSTFGAPPGLEITGLSTINANETTNFFELVDSSPKHNAIVASYFSEYVFTFSEPPISALETGPLVTEWISQNISISPTGSFDNFMNVSGNTLTIAPMSMSGMTIYELTLKPGILSATGKPLTQRTIRFDYQYNP